MVYFNLLETLLSDWADVSPSSFQVGPVLVDVIFKKEVLQTVLFFMTN